MASVFCEHGRVKTTCATCKPRPAERAARPSPPVLPSGRAPGPTPEAAGEAPAEQALRGPGRPLLPQRRRKRGATREEAENADAWWVKRD